MGDNMRYSEAKKLFDTARNKNAGKPLANNTRLVKRGNKYAIQLHQTDVVTISPNDIYTLNTGGWLTVTTKDRINTYAPCRVYSHKGIWQVATNANAYKNPSSAYYDGIKVNAKGKVVSKVKDPNAETKRYAKARRVIKRYIDGFIKHIEAGQLQDPSGGDCWHCCMRTENGQSLGDATTNTDHLINHITENYYVPSLLANALVESFGRTDIGIQWHMCKEPNGKAPWFVRNALNKYFRKRQLCKKI
jgi:hypothetical protein